MITKSFIYTDKLCPAFPAILRLSELVIGNKNSMALINGVKPYYLSKDTSDLYFDKTDTFLGHHKFENNTNHR